MEYKAESKSSAESKNNDTKHFDDKSDDKHLETLPTAYVNFTGVIVDCNKEFSSLVSLDHKSLVGTNITGLCKFDNPNSMLEAAFQLDQLGSGTSGVDSWKAEFNSVSADEDHVMVARRCNKKIDGEAVLEVTGIPVSQLARKHRESMRRSASMPESKMPTSLELSSSPPSSQRVLLVEDSSASLKLMARMISRLGHQVSTATNGMDALELLRKESFDIVLMDINMPMMNGLEASHEFRQLEQQNRQAGKPYQKIIAMSGNISNTLFHEVTNAGFDAFIPKPLTEERFLEVLRLPATGPKT